MKKHILITGSTDGIGKIAAEKCAANGHHVYLHGRNADKLASVIDSIKTQTGNPNISGFVADLAKLQSAHDMAAQIRRTLPQLDVLINNAGVFHTNTPNHANDIDVRLVVNYLAPYILTHTLLPLLKQSNTPRIINLSSAAQAPVSLAALQGKAQLNTNAAYAQSKLALTMWSFALAQAHSDINVIAVNPGSLLNTKMVQQAYGKHWSSADKGANILYELAVSDIYANATGKYFDNDKGDPKGDFGAAHADAYDAHKITALLEATQHIAGL